MKGGGGGFILFEDDCARERERERGPFRPALLLMREPNEYKRENDESSKATADGVG